MLVRRNPFSSHPPRPRPALRGRFLRAASILAGAALAFAWLGHGDRPAQSAVAATRNLISFGDDRTVFWQGVGTASGSWAAFTDGSRTAGNRTVYYNPDTSANDKLSVLQTVDLASPAEFTYQAEARANNTNVWLGVVFNYQANGDHYLFRVKTGGTTWELKKKSGASYANVATGNLTAPGGGCVSTAAVTVPANSYLTLKAERHAANPSQITVSYQGNVQATATDAGALSGGKVGVYVNGNFAFFGNPELTGSINVSMPVQVDAASVVNPIPEDMFGTSLGMFGIDNGISDFITDQATYDASISKWMGYLSLVDDLRPTRMRYPGGVQGNGSYWVQGIGPIAGRRADGFFDAMIAIGTDEALRYAEEAGGKANLIVNIDCLVTGNKNSGCDRVALGEAGSILSAQDWVEYVNYPADGSNANGGVDWAAVRAANGRTQPYAIDVWEIGNEVIQSSAANYANLFNRFAVGTGGGSVGLKGTDPSVKLGAQDDVFFNTLGNRLLWYQNGGNGVNDIAGANIDFWAHHPYGPSPFFSLIFQKDNSVSVTHTFPQGGDFTFTFEAAALYVPSSAYPTLVLQIDGVTRWSQPINQAFSIGTNEFPVWSTTVTGITAGTHTITVQAVGASSNQLSVDTQVVLAGPGSPKAIDLSNADLFYEAVAGVPDAVPTFLGERVPLEGGKPAYATEWNTIYGINARPNDLKSGITNALFLANFLKQGVKLGNFFPLYGETQFVGAIEGVARDAANNQIGRIDPRMRPTGYILAAARQYLSGNLVSLKTAPYGYHYDADDGFLVGGAIGSLYREIPNYVDGLAALQPSGNTLVLMLVNRNRTQNIPLDLSLASFNPASTGTQIVISGADVGSNNEPENGSGGALEVTPVTSALNGVSASFTYTLPARSVVFLVLPKSGSDPNAPSAPSSLVAGVAGSNVNLSWAPSGSGDVAGYNVYRSRSSAGPFANKLNASPVVATNYQDTTAERGYAQYYAIKAVDTDGHESSFSNTANATRAGSAPVWAVPSAVTVNFGTPTGNGVTGLAVADGTTFDVAGVSNKIDFQADFTLPLAGSPTSFAAYYNGTWPAAAKTVRLSLWDWGTSAWVEVVNRTDPQNFPTRLIWGTVNASELTKFVNGSFQVKARVNIDSAGTSALKSDFIAVQARS